jgi:hypothetical protein
MEGKLNIVGGSSEIETHSHLCIKDATSLSRHEENMTICARYCISQAFLNKVISSKFSATNSVFPSYDDEITHFSSLMNLRHAERDRRAGEPLAGLTISD